MLIISPGLSSFMFMDKGERGKCGMPWHLEGRKYYARVTRQRINSRNSDEKGMICNIVGLGLVIGSFTHTLATHKNDRSLFGASIESNALCLDEVERTGIW